MDHRRSYPAVSDTLIKALEKYVKDRIPTGGFLRAVLENDLSTAVSYADGENILILDKIMGFVRCAVPIIAQGNSDKVQGWLAGVEDQLVHRTKLGSSREIIQMDETANETTQIELQHETGPAGKFKLYVHKAGVTIFRMCKIDAEQIEIPEDAVPFINLR